MVKTNSDHHQALNRILNLAEGWIPLTGPHNHSPSLSPCESGFTETVAFTAAKSEDLKALCGSKGLWWRKAENTATKNNYYHHHHHWHHHHHHHHHERGALDSIYLGTFKENLYIEYFRKKQGTISAQQFFLTEKEKEKCFFISFPHQLHRE